MFGKKTSTKLPVKKTVSDHAQKIKNEKHESTAIDKTQPLKTSPGKKPQSATRSIKATTSIPNRPLSEFSLPSSHRGGDKDPSSLLIGRDISLEGKITACERLIVEGVVNVSLPNATAIEITPSGHFTGTAKVDEADISGRFDGELVANERLIVRAGGHINGKIRYGRIVIESGGEVVGDMKALESPKH